MTVPTVRTAADLVAALPLLIGFHPTESVILAAIDENGCIDPTIRADLEPVGEFGPAAAAMLALLPTTHRHTAALSVISAQPRSDALDDLSRTATAAGMRVAVSVYATATTPGAHWTCCCGCGEFGRVPEQNTHLQAQAVFNGRRTLPDRDAVAEVLRPDDEQILARRARLLLGPGPTGPALDLERSVDEFLATGELTDAAVVELVRCLRDTDRSVAVLAARPGDLRLVLETLVRATPAAWAAGPAAFLALAALLHGDGVLADLAAQRAIAADSGANLPQLVARLVATYPSPDTVRGLLTTL